MQHILLCLPLCKPNRGLLAFGRLILTFAFGGVLGCAQGDLAKSNTGGSGGTSGGGQGGLDIVDHEPTDPAFVPQRLRRPSNIEFDKSVASLLSVDDRPARSEPYFDAITDLQIDLLTQAFACDLTRFATFLMNDLSRTKIFADLPEDVHNGVAHTYDSPTGSNYGSPGMPGKPDTSLRLGVQNRYSFGKIARLMQRLDEVGILNHTLLYFSSDMGDPARHSLRNPPTLLAGGGAGKIKMGRRIVLGEDCPPETDAFGTATDAKYTQGALSEL